MHGFNDIYWRCEAPARAIGGKTLLVNEDDVTESLVYPNDSTPFRWHLHLDTEDGRLVCKSREEWERLCTDRTRFTNIQATYPDVEGTAIWTRPCLVRATSARQMQEHGVRTISEVDDNYIANPRFSIALRLQGWDEEGIDLHMKATCSMDAIVFSTELLRDMYAFEMRRRWKTWFAREPKARWPKYPELHVCRNNVDDRDWPEIVERDGPIRVGWMGSHSHIWDVDLAWPALMYASQNGAETWMIGLDPTGDEEPEITIDDRPMRTARSLEKQNAWRRVGFKHIKWRQPKQYERLALPLDIGLCPLLTNKQTLGKSDVKFLEYAISGAAVVAQNNAVYNKTIVHGETGLLVGGPSEMIDAVALLMKNEKLRQELVANAQQYVREERGLKQMRTEWTAAISG